MRSPDLTSSATAMASSNTIFSSFSLTPIISSRSATRPPEDTITEVRANDLFPWLRDFGLEFGWRQTGTLSKLQDAANQGAIALIVARRKQDGKSRHIVIVGPETNEARARRNSAGEVTAPLQGQAGAVNFPSPYRDAQLVEGGTVRRERLLDSQLGPIPRRPEDVLTA